MGQNSPQLKNNEDYEIIEQLPIGNIVKHHKSDSLHFLKEYSFTDQEAYQLTLTQYAQKLSNKNQHLLNFLHFSTKSENSFCSTFHKITLIYEYTDYSLCDEIELRVKEQRPFNQKEMWSVLCSCVLAAVHLQRCEQRMHSCLSTKDIKLTSNGCVKLLSPEMVGLSPTHTLNEGQPKMLAMSIIESFMLQKITNQDTFYLQTIIEGIDCSHDMKQLLLTMLKPETKFVELQQYLFKLVQEDQSIASQSNTPILKSSSKKEFNQNYECPKIQRVEEKKSWKNLQLQVAYRDHQDCPSSSYCGFSEHEYENPDETEGNDEGIHEQQSNMEGTNPFVLKERKMENYENSCRIENNKAQMKSFSQTSYAAMNGNLIENQNPINSGTICHSISNNNIGQQQFTTSQSNNDLFTDPKLISLIKNDLQEIKMRKSMGSFSRTNSNMNLESPVLNKQVEKEVVVREEQINKQEVQTKMKIQMIKQSSQEYRDEESQEREKASLREQFKDVKNIITDTSLGFKKTKRNNENQESKRQKRVEQYLLRQSTQQPERPLQTSKRYNFSKKQQAQMNLFSNYANLSSASKSEELVHVCEDYKKGKYEGTKYSGKRHGYGTFYYSEGGKYVGEWVQNKMQGQGTLFYPSQKLAYKGQWKNDQLEGHGVLYNEDVSILRNPYDYRDWTQVEDYWIKYEGSFLNDNKSGSGILYLSNGERFEGNFKNDMVDGQGILFRAEGKPVKGKWKGNKLINLF